MATKKVGTLIKEARTAAGLSQAALAELAGGVTASDISKTERGEKDLTDTQLKAIAKACGVTQKSLLEAAKNLKTTASSKTTTAKTSTTSKSTSTKTSTSKTGSKTLELTATEKKLVELYRAADTDTRKAAMALLKGEEAETDATDIASVLTGLLGKLGK